MAQNANRGAPEAAVLPARTGYIPLTQKERRQLYFRQLFNVESVLRSGASAGITQPMNTPSEWGQGMAGYSRRFVSSYAGHIVQSTLMYGASATLHEDNRYFLSGQTGVRARLKYALLSTFLTRHDDGSRHFAFSRIGSFAATAGISRAWQPSSIRGPENALNSFTIAVGADAGFNVAREFLPWVFRPHAPVTTDPNPDR